MRRCAALVAWLAVVAGSAASAFGSEPTRLEGTLSVHGDLAMGRIDIPETLDTYPDELAFGPALSVTFRGGGQLKMLVLRGDWEGEYPDVVYAVAENGGTYIFGNTVLTPGPYRVYLLSEKPGLQAQLRVAGQPQIGEVMLADPAPATVLPFETSLGPLGETITYTAADFDRPGAMVAHFRTRGDVGREEWCGAAFGAARDSRSYAPGCQPLRLPHRTVTAGRETAMFWLHFGDAPSTLGLGGNVKFVGPFELSAAAIQLAFPQPDPGENLESQPDPPRPPRFAVLNDSGRVVRGRVGVVVRCLGIGECAVQARLGRRGRPVGAVVPERRTRVLRVVAPARLRRLVARRGGRTARLLVTANGGSLSVPFEVRR